MQSTEVRLAARPSGEPKPSDFVLETVEVGDPAEGEVVVRNLWMSVDPYMRGRMNDAKSYVPPFRLGAPLEGGAVGRGRRLRRPTGTPSATSSCTGSAGASSPSGRRRPSPASRGWSGPPGTSACWGCRA